MWGRVRTLGLPRVAFSLTQNISLLSSVRFTDGFLLPILSLVYRLLSAVALVGVCGLIVPESVIAIVLSSNKLRAFTGDVNAIRQHIT